MRAVSAGAGPIVIFHHWFIRVILRRRILYFVCCSQPLTPRQYLCHITRPVSAPRRVTCVPPLCVRLSVCPSVTISVCVCVCLSVCLCWAYN